MLQLYYLIKEVENARDTCTSYYLIKKVHMRMINWNMLLLI